MTIASPHRYNATQIPAATFFLWGNRVADQLSHRKKVAAGIWI